MKKELTLDSTDKKLDIDDESYYKSEFQKLTSEYKTLKLNYIKLKSRSNKFKGSIVYPFYKITSSIGKTKFGKILQRLIK